MLNFKVSAPQFSYALNKQVLSLTCMCVLNSNRSHSALFNRNGIIHVLSDKIAELKPYCKSICGKLYFPLRKGKKPLICMCTQKI